MSSGFPTRSDKNRAVNHGKRLEVSDLEKRGMVYYVAKIMALISCGVAQIF